MSDQPQSSKWTACAADRLKKTFADGTSIDLNVSGEQALAIVARALDWRDSKGERYAVQREDPTSDALTDRVMAEKLAEIDLAKALKGLEP